MTRSLPVFFLLLVLTLAACQPQAAVGITPRPDQTRPTTLTMTPVPIATSTLVAIATQTLYPLPTLEMRLVPCNERNPGIDLYVIVNATFSISSRYVPPELVQLGGYVSGYVTLPDLMLRREAAEALARLVNAMKNDNLHPTVLSAYRESP